MMHEIDIYGVLVSPMLIWTGMALIIVWLLRQVLEWIGLYRFVWHRPLFDLSVLIVILGGVVAVTAR